MFDNIGGKIKGLAKLVCWLGIIMSVISGIVLSAASESGIGVLIAIGGSVLAWIGSFFTYGFGQLVQNSDILVGRVDSDKVMSTAQKIELDNQDHIVGEYEVGRCSICDKENIKVREIQVNNDLGTRYQKMCDECFDWFENSEK